MVTISELERRLSRRRVAPALSNIEVPMLAITFDDGFADNAEEAAAVLSSATS